MTNISTQQRRILVWLINQVRSVEQDNRKLLESEVDWLLKWSPQTADKVADKALENVWRASLCRSLARLEQRGLVTRIRGPKKARTVRVLLTDEGRRVAETVSAY